ncbi:MAG: carbon-nitrogen hydrolase family protein [Bacteroidota bacterium]
MKNTKIAVVQEQAIHLDLSASLQKAISCIESASKANAQIAVFGECWLSGYPAWIDYIPNLGKWDHEPVKSTWAKLFENSLSIQSEEMEQLCNAASENNIIVVMGFHEAIVVGKGNSTLYNSFVIINHDGKILNHHRKLMPTYNEKLIHGLGDGAGLKAVDTSAGRLGGLICWEHFMPLNRQALHDEGEDIHFALWPMCKERHLLASRHYAFEGRCYVVAVGQIMQVKDVPSKLEHPESWTDPSQFILDGGSCVIGPDAQYLLEPQYGNADIFYVDLPNKTSLLKERMNLATSGHYQRYDIFDLKINKNRPF